MKRPLCRAGLLLVPLLLCLVLVAEAQPHRCDTCYRHFKYDSTLRFGAHLVNNARVARDELTLDYGQYYGKDFHELANQVRSTGTSWADTWNHKFFDTVDQKSFKTIFVPLRVDRVMNNAATVENYFGKDCRPNCDGKPLGWDPATLQAYDLWLNRTNGLVTDPLWHGKIWGYTVPSSDTAVLVGGGPRFAAHVTPQAYVQLWEDLYGIPLASSKDSSKYLSLTVSLKVNPTDFIGVDDTAKIAKIVLYKRYLTSQGDTTTSGVAHCMCDIFQPFDTIYVTRGTFNDGSTPTLQTSANDPQHLNPYHDVVVKVFPWDARTLPPSGWKGRPTDFWYGDASPDTTCVSYCRDSILPHAPAGSIADNLPESDLNFRVYSTGVVPLTVLRTRVARYGYEKLKKGELDNYLKADIDTADANTAIKKMLWQISPDDEPEIEQFRGLGLVSDRLQQIMHAKGDTTRGIWVNAIKNYDGLELLSQDADVDAVKLIHTLVPQSYVDGGAVPIFYANPDSMDAQALTTYFQPSPGPDTVVGPYVDPDTKVIDRSRTMSIPRPKGIRFNTSTEYDLYTSDRQREYGKFSAARTIDGVVSGYFVEYAARAVDVAHFKYPALGVPAVPVHPVVRVHGFIQQVKDSTGKDGFSKPLWFNVPTPEEITCRSWLSMNCGADGVMFSDFIYDGLNFGVMQTFTGEHSAEYDTLRHPDPNTYSLNPSGWTTPKIWVGFRSRFGAVKRVIAELRKLDSVVGWHRLVYKQEQMSLHDTAQCFSSMPIVDTVYTRRAKLRDLGTGGSYLDSVNTSNPLLAYDSKDKTYMEVTHFWPGAGDTNTTSHYLLFTNRRTWPNDQNHYSSTARTAGAAEYGLGYIDVRRPVVRFKNSVPTLADSFLVVKVGHESDWPSRKITAGDSIELDWLEPGWGALYRVTPLRSGVSSLGTAYANAVHSVNISDTARKGQVIVYERDSIVYAMTMDTAGNWSKEFRLSDTADAGASRVAYTVNPAVSTVRNGTSWLAVWERINASTGASTVQGRYFPRFPNPDSLSTSKLVSLLTSSRTTTPYRMTPAVTGIDSGYVVAWAVPTGIECVAMKDTGAGANISALIKATLGKYDTLYQFPTLAYVRKYNGTNHPVHVAWQQSNVVGTQIVYSRLNARFPSNQKPALVQDTTYREIVSASLPGCQYQHPSIAADSVRVGVAFEGLLSAYLGAKPYGAIGFSPISVIVLRFRDSLGIGAPWKTRTYYWGNDTSVMEWPSLTQFPAGTIASQTGTGGVPQGALSWFRVKSSKGIYQQYLFRYGRPNMDTLTSGRYPTLTLVPFRRTAPFLEYSSAFYRDKDPRSFLGTRPLGGGNGTYYDAALINHPTNRHVLFQGIGTPNRPVSVQKTLKPIRIIGDGQCLQATFTTGINIRPGLDGYPADSVTVKPDLPPSYFAAPDLGVTRVDTLTDAMKVTRTGVFTAGSSPFTIERRAFGSDSLTAWLNTEPYDSAAGKPADILSFLEVVRASDGFVIWRGDTVSARAVDTATWDDNVAIPAVAPLGTNVYIQQRTTTTAGFTYDVDAGFWHQFDTTDAGFLKPVGPGAEHAIIGQAAALRVLIVPNPARSTAEIRVTMTEAGTLDLGVYDVTGNLVDAIPPTPVSRPGEYAVSVDVSGLSGGFYSVRAHLGSHTTAVPLTVSR